VTTGSDVDPGDDTNLLMSTEYYPMDHTAALADADMFPFLIKLATQGEIGLSIDIGASLGNCAYPILSLGHQVHLILKS